MPELSATLYAWAPYGFALSWCLPKIEAAGYGIPTVARDVPGLRDSIRDGETGFLVDDDADLDVVRQRLTGAILTALRELEAPENRRLAFKASTTWAAGFSWSRMHQDAVDLVVDERQARSGPRTTSAPPLAPPSAPTAAPAASIER